MAQNLTTTDVREHVVDVVLTLSDITDLNIGRADGYVLMGGVKPLDVPKEQAYRFHAIVRRVWHAIYGGERKVTHFVVRGESGAVVVPDASIADPVRRAAVLVDEAMETGANAGIALAAAGQLCLASGLGWPVRVGGDAVQAFQQALGLPAGEERVGQLISLFQSEATA